MYGLVEGIRGGAADARQMQQLEMERERMARMAAIQAAQEQRAQEEHVGRMADLGLRRRQQEGIDTAMTRVRGLAERDDAQAGQVAAKGIMSFAPEDWTDTSERAYNKAYMGLAAAKGDAEGMDKLRTRNKLLDVQDEADRLSQDPAFQQRALGLIHKNDLVPVKIIEGKRDPKTGKPTAPATIKFDTGAEVQLDEASARKLAYGAALMAKGFNKEGLDAIAGVNKELAQAVDTANRRTLGMYKEQSGAEDRFDDNVRKDEELGLRREMLRLQRANTPRRDKEIPKELQDQYAQMQITWLNEQDPRKKAEIERQMQIQLVRMNQSIGKVGSLPSNAPRGGMSEKDLNDQAIRLVEMSGGKLSLAGAKAQLSGSYDPEAAMAAALDKIAREKEAKNGARGGAPSSGGTGLVKPPGAPADYGRYGAPGYQTYMQDMALQQWLQAQQGRGGLGLSMPQRPVDFSKYNTPR